MSTDHAAVNISDVYLDTTNVRVSDIVVGDRVFDNFGNAHHVTSVRHFRVSARFVRSDGHTWMWPLDTSATILRGAPPCPLSKWDWHEECSPLPRYTDGTDVHAGDSVRYRQAPGGILPPSPEWKYGEAVVSSHCSGTLDLAGDDGRTYHLLGHIIERTEAVQ